MRKISRTCYTRAAYEHMHYNTSSVCYMRDNLCFYVVHALYYLVDTTGVTHFISVIVLLKTYAC